MYILANSHINCMKMMKALWILMEIWRWTWYDLMMDDDAWSSICSYFYIIILSGMQRPSWEETSCSVILVDMHAWKKKKRYVERGMMLLSVFNFSPMTTELFSSNTIAPLENMPKNFLSLSMLTENIFIFSKPQSSSWHIRRDGGIRLLSEW